MNKKEQNLLNALPDDPEIKEEYKRLLNLFKDAPERELALAMKEISRAAFLGITLDRLERDIAANGVEEVYQNGATQKGKKKTAAADLHTSYTKNYLAVMKQLHDRLNSSGIYCVDEDEFDRF